MSKLVRSLLLQGVFFGAALALLWWGFHHFPVEQWIGHAQRRIGAMQWWSAVLYPLFLAGCNALLLPAGILSVGSGLIFGLWWGFFLVWLGTLLGAAISFGVARALGRQWVKKKLFRYPKLAALDAAIAREGGRIVMLSQLHPLFPTSLLHYLYGITRLRFWPCMGWTAIGQAPGLFLYVYFGTLAQYGLKLVRHQTHPHLLEYFVWIGGLLLTFGVTFALGRLALRLLREIENPPASLPAPPAVDSTRGSDPAAIHAKF